MCSKLLFVFFLLILFILKLFSKYFLKISENLLKTWYIYAQNLLKPHPNFLVENLLSLACTAKDGKRHVSPNIKLLNMLYMPYITQSIHTFSEAKWRSRIAKHVNFFQFSRTKFSKTAGLWRCQQVNSDFL